MAENASLSTLPKGWTWAGLDDIGEIITGTTPRKNHPEYYGKDCPFFKPADLNAGFYVRSSEDKLSEYGMEHARLVPEKTVLVTCIGATIGKTGFTRVQGAYNQQINAIVVNREILAEFVYFMVISPQFQKSIIKNASATTLPILNKSRFQNLLLPLPPFNEQRRIVSRVEELFSVLDAGVESLRKVKAQLKRYRQAVLKYAFEGKLTEKWRKTHKNQIQPILVDPTVTQHSLVASDLPENWLLLTIPDIVTQGRNSIKRGPFGSSIKKEYFVPSGYKVYEQKNVIYNDFNLGSYFISEDKFHQMEDFELKSGDIVITCSGTIGKIAIAPADLKRGIINQALLKLTLDKTRVSSKYFLHLFTSKMREIISDATRGSAMKNISSVKDLKQISFPIPPVLEQQKIVEEIEYRFSLADAVDKVTDQALVQADRLRQSILRAAFQGKLVPQDPADEPAEKLLERIKEERANQMFKEGTNKIKTSKETLEEFGLMRYVK